MITNIHKRVIKDWVNALRSGRYEQCYFTLCDGNNKFCALGVLADIYGFLGKEKNSGNWIGKSFYDISINNSEIFGFFIDFSSLDRIFGMNDLEKRTFNYIADYIEKEYLK